MELEYNKILKDSCKNSVDKSIMKLLEVKDMYLVWEDFENVRIIDEAIEILRNIKS